MPKTYAQVVAVASGLLQDTTNAVFATTEFDNILPDGLEIVSLASPWEYKLTKTTTASSYDISLTAGDKWRLLTGTGYKGTGIAKAEYLVDKNPREFRGLSRFRDTISLELTSRPSSAVSVYLFMNKIHILQSALGTTDTAGAVKTLAAAGAVSLALKSLGTGTINDMSTLTIAGDSTTYYVIATATIAANEATVSIWPPLAVAAAVDAVVTLALTDSTLDARLEKVLARWLAATAAISKSTLYYQQVSTAITTLSNAATAVAAIAARITQAVADIVSGRTEAAKISAILDTANTEIDKIGARLTQATTDVASGRTEADKVPAIVTTAATAISAIAARVTQALTDIASARTAIALGVTAISSANTEMGLSDAQVDLAVTALSSGNALLNTIPIGGGAGEYMGQASSDVGTAQGYVLSGQGLLQKSSADFNNANADLGVASREVDAGMARLREAQVNLEQARTDIGANSAYIDQCVAQLRLAQGYFQEAQGYVMESNARMANNASYLQTATGELRAAGEKNNEAISNLRLVASRMQVSQGGINYERWGRAELQKVEMELLAIGGLQTSVRYPRD